MGRSASALHHPPSQRRLAIVLTLGGATRAISLGSIGTAVVAVVVPVLAAWYLGATLYFVFHDRLVAALVARQAEAQYAYEDRIAALSTELERETSSGLLERRERETTLRMLEERSAALAAHAALLEGLTGHGSFAADPTPSRPAAAIAPPALRAGGDATDTSAADGRARSDTHAGAVVSRAERVAAALADAERDQGRALSALREPALATIARYRAALAVLGLSPAKTGGIAPTAAGGPYVPLATTSLSFEQNATLVREARLEAARLAGLIDRVPLRQPLPGQLDVTSAFGPRVDPFLGRAALHTGVDLRQRAGEDVKATAAGTVVTAARDGGYGVMVEVDHGHGLSTRYAHLAAADVVPGQRIVAGSVIGQVGSTGRATGPHLHYETRIDGEPVDPERFFAAGALLIGR